MADQQSNINNIPKNAIVGLFLDSVTTQLPQGALSWAVNAVVESFDGNQVTYSNEQANTLCVTWPTGYRPIGLRNILEENLVFAWLLNSVTGDCEIGMVSSCTYTKIINAKCLNFGIDNPILKHAHRNTNCGLEIYWTDGRNRVRWIQLEKLPLKENRDGATCKFVITSEIDCNKLNLQPDFSIPKVDLLGVNAGGFLKEGDVQFGVQYANALGEPYTSFYGITNPIPIFDGTQANQNFDNPVSKNVSVRVSDIDTTGIFDYINVAVIETVNNIPTVKLVGTFQINDDVRDVTYAGNGTPMEKAVGELFQRYPVYTKATDLTTAQDVLILGGVTQEERISYQEIANKIKLKWATVRLNGKTHPYLSPPNVTAYTGYMRDEIYPYEIVFELKNGHVTDGFFISGRAPIDSDLELILNDDVRTNSPTTCDPDVSPLPRWKVYNTAKKTGMAPSEADDCYEGPWESGEFAYWESTDTYPCQEIFGDLQGKPIRVPKFPDCLVSPIHDDRGFIYPIGVQIDVQEIVTLIKNSSLTQEQKNNIQAFRIVRGNRGKKNASITGKGLLTNVLKASTENKIINATTGTADEDGTSGAETVARKLLEDAFDFTNKGHRESNAYAFLNILGTITIGKNAEQNARYNYAERLLTRVRSSPSDEFFSQANIDVLQTASNELQNIINNSGGDTRGKSHSQAAKSLVDGLIQLMQAEIALEATMAAIDVTAFTNSDFNKFEYFPNYLFNDLRIGNDGKPADFFLDNTIIDDDAHYRYALHSPDMSFEQPELGTTLKLESAEYGVSSGHMVEVKNHARYQFISEMGYITALLAGVTIGFASGSYGVGSVNVFNGEATFAAYQAFLDILYKTVPKKNFAYQFNAVGDYQLSKPVPNTGNKQRLLDLATYISPGKLNVNDKYTLNNWQRESAVYLRTTKPLPFVHTIPGVPPDSSKIAGATFSTINVPISSYYASLKNEIPNQWGQLYSYETIDTGYTKKINFSDAYGKEIVFGGDTFINKFAYKSKLPFFLDNRVNPQGNVIWQDGSDISYNELSNVGRVKYWFSTDVKANTSFFDSFFATMTQHFFWPHLSELYMSGVIFLFAYGIPYFFCESAINVDMRKAYDNGIGDFYPRVSSGIPDDWLQETYNTIQQDNSYWYNKTFSKQNIESSFTHIPTDYTFDPCLVEFPFRAVVSEPMTDNPSPSLRNNWRIFKPASRFDFPENYGKLISLDGIETQQVLARFENKTLLYNTLLTAPSSVAQIYLGKSLFSRTVPPVDYADTDAGYIGSQHKMLLKTEYGHIIVDSKRGDIHIINGQKSDNLANKGVGKFMTEFLDFQIKKAFPEVDIDNHFKGIGLHGVFDTKYNRIIFTKLDYKPVVNGISYKDGNFYLGKTLLNLEDTNYFCNYSFTASYSFTTNSWVSFHTYLPNYYVPEPNVFYSGKPDAIWQHNVAIDKFNNFYGSIHPYILEYPYAFNYLDEILQSIQDYSKVLKYSSFRTYVETDQFYFNKFIGWNGQQSTGLLELAMKQANNMFFNKQFPKYNTDSKTVLVSKSGSFYNINTFWDMVKDPYTDIWTPSCVSVSDYKMLNDTNHDYGKRSYHKAPLRSKELKLRWILDDKDDIKIISGFTLASTMQSYK